MVRFRLVVASLAAVLAACSDVGVDECLEQAVSEQVTAQDVSDWRAEVDSLVATAPTDSVLDIVVFVAARSRAGFEAWAGGRGVPITYEFLGFSAYRISPRVDVLLSLKDVPGVTGIDWGIGSIAPACQSLGPSSARAFNQVLLAREASAIRLPASPVPGEGGRPGSRTYIVGFYGSGSDLRGEDRAILRAAGAAERYYFYGFRATSVYLDPAAVERLWTHPGVAWIDSSVAMLGPSEETTGWSYTRHGFNLAHDDGLFGHGDVRVAVIGDGVQCSLADLSCSTGVNITGDPNVDGGSGHETLIASIIAAGVGNGIGIQGGAPYVSLHSVRAANPWDHQISCQHLAEAIDIATARYALDADIVNLSYGSDVGTCGAGVDSALANAVWGEAAIVVAAAGNGGMGQVAYPANHPLTLAVSAMKRSPFKIASFSNYGTEIDIAAGGEMGI